MTDVHLDAFTGRGVFIVKVQGVLHPKRLQGCGNIGVLDVVVVRWWAGGGGSQNPVCYNGECKNQKEVSSKLLRLKGVGHTMMTHYAASVAV